MCVCVCVCVCVVCVCVCVSTCFKGPTPNVHDNSAGGHPSHHWWMANEEPNGENCKRTAHCVRTACVGSFPSVILSYSNGAIRQPRPVAINRRLPFILLLLANEQEASLLLYLFEAIHVSIFVSLPYGTYSPMHGRNSRLPSIQ